MIKRLIVLLLTIILVFGIAGCERYGEREKENNGEKESVSGTSEVESKEDGKEETTDKNEENNKDSEGSKDVEDKKQHKEHDEVDEKACSPILYKATDDKGNNVWLLGTIHVGREEFYPLPDYVLDAFTSSDAIAVEFDIVAAENDTSAMTDMMMEYVYTDGTTIKEHIPADTYNSAVAILDDCGYYFSTMDYFIPSMWEQFVYECMYEKMEINMELGVDKYFIEKAMETDKEILEVESMEFQFGMMRDFSEDLQIYLLESVIEAYGSLDEGIKEIDSLMDMWMYGDESELKEYLKEDTDGMSKEELELYEEYNYAMMTSRNNNMTKFTESALKSGKEVFICVGAAHVIGESGIVEQLTSLGYMVERVK